MKLGGRKVCYFCPRCRSDAEAEKAGGASYVRWYNRSLLRRRRRI